MKPKYYAQGTMNTKDGQLLGTVRYNPAQRKWQSNIDGELSGEFKTKELAVDDLERAGVKNIKINKDYVMEGKIKPTKRQIMIVEDFVNKTTKKIMNESESREMIRAANKISNIIEQVFDKYGLDGSRFGPTNDKDLAGKRILNAIPSEIADIILANSEIIKLIKAG